MPRNEQLLVTSAVLLEVLSELALDQQKRCHLSWGWNHCTVRNLELFPPHPTPHSLSAFSPAIVISHTPALPGRQVAREPGKRNSLPQYIAERSKVARETEQKRGRPGQTPWRRCRRVERGDGQKLTGEGRWAEERSEQRPEEMKVAVTGSIPGRGNTKFQTPEAETKGPVWPPLSRQEAE